MDGINAHMGDRRHDEHGEQVNVRTLATDSIYVLNR